MLASRSLLIIHFQFSGVYVSMPNSLTIPSPLATISSLSKSVSPRELSVMIEMFCITTVHMWLLSA